MSIEKIKKGDELTKSKDLVSDNITKLKELFPEIVTEGKIDFDVLQDVLGNEIETGEEYYRFTWAGKAQARREAHKPSTGTLRPSKEDSVDWDNTKNIYIEGDNLEVLKLLQKSYANKIKMIYIDPPYNTGRDFVYKDNYKDNLSNYLEITGQKDEEGKKLSTNTESDGRYHSNWLNMMYPRLKLARNLLKEDGVIFMSIDDSEVENLKKLGNEIFGEENFLGIAVRRRRKSQANLSKNISIIHEYVLIYAKTNSTLLNKIKPQIDKKAYKNPDNDPRGAYVTMPCTNKGGAKYIIITPTGKRIEEEWRFKQETYIKLKEENRLVFPKDGEGKPRYKLFLNEKLKSGVIPNSWWSDISSNQEATVNLKLLFDNEVYFEHPKPVDLIKLLIVLAAQKNFFILDFFSGAATTAHAVMQLNAEDGGNRKHIQVQLPEPTDTKSEAYKAGYKTIAEIGKERIRRAGKKIIEDKKVEIKELKSKGNQTEEDKNKIQQIEEAIANLDIGFKVFKLDSSNIKAWEGNPKALEQSLFDAVSNIKADRTEEDILFEILLKYGLDLTLPIEEKTVEGVKVFNVGMGALFVCLGDNITSKVAEGIGKWKEELNPEVCRVIFKDTGFTDVEKTNSAQILKRYGITEIRSI